MVRLVSRCSFDLRTMAEVGNKQGTDVTDTETKRMIAYSEVL